MKPELAVEITVESFLFKEQKPVLLRKFPIQFSSPLPVFQYKLTHSLVLPDY